MRARSRRGSFLLALCAIALGWFTTTTADAAFAPVDPEQLASAPRIDEAQPWVSPLGEQFVFYREIDPQQVLGLRTRAPGAGFGPVQSLTGEANFEMPRDVSFGADGEAFASWGIATTGKHGQFALQTPGTLFGPTKESPCSRFSSSSVGPHGELGVACDIEEGAGKYRVMFTETVSLGLFPGSETLLGSSLEFTFLEPKIRYGADGTLAIAWRYEAGGKRFVEVAVRPAGSKGGLTTQTLIEAPTPSEAGFFEDLAVTADGTVIVLATTSEGLDAYVRPSGGSFSPVKVGSTLSGGTLGVDAAGNAIVVVNQFSIGGSTIQYEIRPPGGSFGTAQDVVPAGAYEGANLSVAPDGTAFAELFKPAPGGIDIAVRPPGGSFGTPLPIAAAGTQAAGFAVTPGDDLLASWTLDSDKNGAGDEVFAGGLDAGAPPALTDVSVPTAGVLGVASAFSAHASDTMGMRGVGWSFGDGTSAAGESVSHAYAAAGMFTVTVTATDRAGNTSSATRTISVIDPNAKPPPAAVAAAGGPAITLKLPRSVRFKSLLKRGVTVEVATSEPSTVLGNLLGRARGGHIAAVGDLIVASKTLRNVKAKRKLVLRPVAPRLGKRRSLSLTVQVVATDARGLQRTVTRKLKVKR
jgi:hypothetical protein